MFSCNPFSQLTPKTQRCFAGAIALFTSYAAPCDRSTSGFPDAAPPSSGAATTAPARITQTGSSPDIEAPDQKVALRKLLEIDGEFGGVTAVAVDSAGNVYAADAVNQQIAVFAPGGRRLRTIGRRGRGPGEFSGLRDVVIARDTLFAFDQTLQRITAFTIPEPWLLSYTVRLSSSRGLARYYALIPASGGFLVQYIQPQEPQSVIEERRSIVLRWLDASSSVVIDSLLVLPDLEWLVTTDERYGYAVGPLPFGKRSLLRIASDGRLFHAWTGEPLISVFDSLGNQVSSIAFPREPQSVTSDDIDVLRQSYVDLVGPQAASIVFGRVEAAIRDDRLPKQHPVMKSFLLDDEGRVWVQLITEHEKLQTTPTGLRYVTSGVEGGGTPSSTWWILDLTDGKVGEAELAGNVVLHLIRGGRAYGVSEDDLGVHRIVVYELGLRPAD